MSIYECIKRAKNGDQSAKMELITKFRPLMRKYNRRYFNDDIEADLIIGILELIIKIDLSKFDESAEGALVNYIALAIRNKYIDLIKKSSFQENMQTNYSEILIGELLEEDFTNSTISNIYLRWLFEQLPNFQKEIISAIYIDGKREIDIANEKKLSKQSISNAKRRAVQKLKKIYEL